MDGEGSERIGVDGDVGAGAGIGIGLDRNAMKGADMVRWSWLDVVVSGCGVVARWSRMDGPRSQVPQRQCNASAKLRNFKKSASFRHPLHSFLPMPAADVGPREEWCLALPHDCVLFGSKRKPSQYMPSTAVNPWPADIEAHGYIDAWGTLQHALGFGSSNLLDQWIVSCSASHTRGMVFAWLKPICRACKTAVDIDMA